jgi:acyl carrier protein
MGPLACPILKSGTVFPAIRQDQLRVYHRFERRDYDTYIRAQPEGQGSKWSSIRSTIEVRQSTSYRRWAFHTRRLAARGKMTRSGFLRAMEEILDVPKRTLREEDSRDTVAQWTSLADVQIFSLITSEFGIEPDSELIEAETVGDLLTGLQGKGAFRE